MEKINSLIRDHSFDISFFCWEVIKSNWSRKKSISLQNLYIKDKKVYF